MQKLFSVVRFVLLMVVAWFASQSDSRPSLSGFLAVCIALMCFILFGVLGHFIAYRRLCWRLGVAHEIWANADRFENLRFMRWETFPYWALARWREPTYALYIVRGFFGTLRGWWVWQCIYEVVLACVVVVGLTYTLVPAFVDWSMLPVGVAAVIVLASNRAFAIYDPSKFFS
ncbi:hypothetical protein BH11CYA1_BH11CYA1_23310 [soil metagenome]